MMCVLRRSIAVKKELDDRMVAIMRAASLLRVTCKGRAHGEGGDRGAPGQPCSPSDARQVYAKQASMPHVMGEEARDAWAPSE